MQFLLDENVHRGLVAWLAKRGHEARFAPKGISNGAVFKLAVSAGRILVTHDADFATTPPIGLHPGIIFIRILPRRFEKLKRSFEDLLRSRSSPHAFRGKLIVLFDDRTDELPFTSKEVLL